MEEIVFALERGRIFINIGTKDISRPDYRVERLMESGIGAGGRKQYQLKGG